jgi:hypothetical protein
MMFSAICAILAVAIVFVVRQLSQEQAQSELEVIPVPVIDHASPRRMPR